MANTAFVVLATIATIFLVIGGAYYAGILDDYIEDLGVFAFKFKAKAEAKKLGMQGLQEGTDFLASDLKGNRQAQAVQDGEGLVGGLKQGGEGLLGGSNGGLVGGLKSGGEGLTKGLL